MDDSYWTSREDSLELIELSNINKVSLGSSVVKLDQWTTLTKTSREDSLELIELSNINKVSLG